MKDKQKLIMDLRYEYLALAEKISKARFAIQTLQFNDEEEQEMLVTQVHYMNEYAEMLLHRANYAQFGDNPPDYHVDSLDELLSKREVVY